MKRDRISTTVLFVGTALVVVAVGLLAALVMWLLHPSAQRPCTVNCAPPRAGALALVAGLAEGGSYAGSLGFHVEYPTAWKLQESKGDVAVFQTRTGLMKVAGVRGAPGFSSLVDGEIDALDSADLPDIKAVGAIDGAHIGTQEGQGRLFSATFYSPSGGGRSLLVRIGIVSATKGNVTVTVTALVPYDAKTGQVVAEDVDYALTEFLWPGQ